MMKPAAISGTAVALNVDGALAGVLLRGPPGAGKSDLALRLIDKGAFLIADDQTLIAAENNALIASAPQTIRGLMEVRGVGILAVPSIACAPLVLIVDLVAHNAVPRLPEPEHEDLTGIRLPRLKLNPAESSADAKIRLAVQALKAGPKPGVTFPFASG